MIPAGARGIIIAALLAAAMSTLDSVLNVLSTISVVNIYSRFSKKTTTDKQNLKAAKIMTVFWGVVIVSISMFMINIKSIFVMINSVIGIMTGPVSGLFVLGMFFKRTKKKQEFIGKFRGWSRDDIIARIREISGLYGLDAGVAYRDLESMDDEKIESILEDLEMVHRRRGLQEGDDAE